MDAEKIAREIVYGPPISTKPRAIAEAIRSAYASGYAAAREQAAICVKKCKSLDENGYICEKSEAIVAIEAMEP